MGARCHERVGGELSVLDTLTDIDLERLLVLREKALRPPERGGEQAAWQHCEDMRGLAQNAMRENEASDES